MNTGQMLLTVGALILLSSMLLRFNRSVMTSDDVMMNSKFNVLASSLCISVIEEARGKAFDQNTDNAAVGKTDELSKNLGPDFGEKYENSTTSTISMGMLRLILRCLQQFFM